MTQMGIVSSGAADAPKSDGWFFFVTNLSSSV